VDFPQSRHKPSAWNIHYAGIIHSETRDAAEFKKLGFRIDQFLNQFSDRTLALFDQFVNSPFTTGLPGLLNPFLELPFFIFPE